MGSPRRSCLRRPVSTLRSSRRSRSPVEAREHCRSRCPASCTTSVPRYIRWLPDRHSSPLCRWPITASNGFTAMCRLLIRSTMEPPSCCSTDLADQDSEFGPDAKAWRSLVQEVVDNWETFALESLGPVVRIPRHPLLMARFGLAAFQPARRLANHHFTQPRTRALFAGLGAHSFLSLDDVLSSAVALVLGAAAHVVGWPVPRGGSQSITQCAHRHLGESRRKAPYLASYHCRRFPRMERFRHTSHSSTPRPGNLLPSPVIASRLAFAI